MTIKLLHAKELNATIQSQVEALYKQLNAVNVQRPLEQILHENNNVIVAVCRDNEAVVAIAMLSTYIIISGHRGIVEDVVVDSAYRGKGIGKKLMQKLLEEAKKQKLDEILLFTGHHRTAAINLYKGLGFTLRKSGVYNMKL
ncbi:GNAT family N-acetyltransferase [Costertonia aggregata]|uniref:GNAT family N-acetyltransferase n=1 Tax=Costertonia aggregata TaxID=343403 RepID=A0A7H9AUY4_9FLAO|nr:GNAT family N-acetyltransferase [Costertonia aggregata]QLG47005.1 GNAT family N-acetyltransferase [Costertonia aggregata]